MSAENPCTSASGSWPELCDLRARARDEDWLIDVEDACSLDERLGEGTTALAFSAHWLGAKVVVKKIKVMKIKIPHCVWTFLKLFIFHLVLDA